ncbi:MAG: diaminopimelate epimerase [Dehalococcoidia bacterium]
MKFVKMQGTGNDFILIDARKLDKDWSKLAQRMCHRHFGIGSDGLLVVQPSRSADLRMRMFNPDGSEAEACGNGIRCFAKYAVESGLAGGDSLRIETLAGVREVRLFGDGGRIHRVQVGMGQPELGAEDIPVNLAGAAAPILDYPLTIEGRKLLLTFVSMGNPHAVCFLEEPVSDFPLAELGPRVEHHPMFPQRTNFEIANVQDGKHITARVWERGAGETLSCGSGACAIAVAARLHGYIENKVDITLPGGMLTLEWDGRGEVYLSGPAETVFTGEWPEEE